MQAIGSVFTSGTAQWGTFESTGSVHDFVSEHGIRKLGKGSVYLFGWLVSAVGECSSFSQASFARNF